MGNTLLGLLFLLLRSLMAAHTAIFDGLDHADDAGGTTLTAGIAVRIDSQHNAHALDPDLVCGCPTVCVCVCMCACVCVCVGA